jgi:hypothetical protein
MKEATSFCLRHDSAESDVAEVRGVKYKRNVHYGSI